MISPCWLSCRPFSVVDQDIERTSSRFENAKFRRGLQDIGHEAIGAGVFWESRSALRGNHGSGRTPGCRAADQG
jgi:hypothetical protein